MRIRTFTVVGSVVAIAASIPLGMAFAAASGSSNSRSHNFQSAGQGTSVSESKPGCQFTAAGCTIKTTGYANNGSLGNGKYTETITIDWAANYSNGKGGYCAPSSGPSVLTTSHGKIDIQTTGTVCEVAKSVTFGRHVFFGTYSVTGGTGRFAHASGTGSSYGGDNGFTHNAYVSFGTIKY
jgi:hypothetical protein